LVRRNLFSVDTDEVGRLLAEANEALISQSRQLIEEFQRIPDKLMTENERAEALAFSKMLKGHLKECRLSRLSDAKSFRDAVKTVQSFYEEFETPLKAAEHSVIQAITQAEVGRAEVKGSNLDAPAVVYSDTGVRIATSASPNNLEIELTWSVSAVDRDQIDLEALRPFFTEHVLMQTTKKYLERHGPNNLVGAHFEQLAKV
jgi:hypothetical protein